MNQKHVYYLKNKIRYEERQLKFKLNNHAYFKQYYIDNKEIMDMQRKQYNLKNEEHIKNRNKIYRYKNPEKYLVAMTRFLTKLGKQFNIDSKEYRFALNSWSKTIKNRDKKCKICGSIVKLIAHHVLYKSGHPKLSLDLNNGITL